MQEALCFADAGSVRLCTAGLDVYILNGMGDGPVRVYVGDDLPVPAGTIYLGMVDVRGEAFIAKYDCERDPYIDVPPGRYQMFNHVGAVYLNRIGDLTSEGT